jgi:hypothetical protein
LECKYNRIDKALHGKIFVDLCSSAFFQTELINNNQLINTVK